MDNNKLNMTNILNRKNNFWILFWNKSANETDLDKKRKDNNKDNKNLKEKYFKTGKKFSFEILK